MRNEILKMLENNSRIDLHDLAIMLGTDESMVLEEIEKMENEGIICGYPTLINWDKTDTEKVTAFIEVRVTLPHKEDRALKNLQKELRTIRK